MCAIVGLVAQSNVSTTLYNALLTMQHRGQDAAGIATYHHEHLYLRKANGLVHEVIRDDHIVQLPGSIGIGHVRYSTAGSNGDADGQPFYVNSPYGISLVHNGHLTNAAQLAHQLRHTYLRHLHTHSDSEVLLNVLAHELQKIATVKLTFDLIVQAVQSVYRLLKGAYSVIAMINGHGLLAFRDPYGIRPLVYGKRVTGSVTDYMIVSESVALDIAGFDKVADIAPGEVCFIDQQQHLSRRQCYTRQPPHLCLFECIYLARPDSVMDGIPIDQARSAIGSALARRIIATHSAHDIDIVVPIPDTSRIVALAVAQQLDVPLCEGFVKNHYVGRTFIMPDQVMREQRVRMKLNPIKAQLQGKNVLLVDDSIVRGTTARNIVRLTRAAGVRKVYFASAAPPVRYPNRYGINLPSDDELIAAHHDIQQVSALIGTDYLIYPQLQEVQDAINSVVLAPQNTIERFEDSMFTGRYITEE